MKWNYTPPPQDKTRIIRWHKIYKCLVTVFWNPKFDEGCPWVDGTLSSCWPEEAFLKGWSTLPEGPKEKNNE